MNLIKTDSGQGSPKGAERNPLNPFHRSEGVCFLFKFRMLYFFGVKGVIRSYRSAQELKADTLTPASHLALTPLTPKKYNIRNLNKKHTPSG